MDLIMNKYHQTHNDKNHIHSRIQAVNDYVKLLQSELLGKYESEVLDNTIKNIIHDTELLAALTSEQNTSTLQHELSEDSISETIYKIVNKSKSTARHFIKKSYNNISFTTAHKLFKEAELLERINSDPSTAKLVYNKINETRDNNIKKIATSFQDVDNKIKNLDKYLTNVISDSSSKFTKLDGDFKTLEERANKELDTIKNSHSNVIEEINNKNNQINDVLDLASTRFISVDYDRSVQDEKKAADWLRLGSLTCMGLIALMLGYTFWETTNTEFNWQKSIFRITLTFLLSVPAAYLARESAKHREQQYQHLQTSLDLKAIPSFMASLPVEEQNKFKLDIANRVFASREHRDDLVAYPINMQEVIMALLRKFEDIPNPKDNSKHN